MREVHDEQEESVALIRLADVSEDMGELDEAESRYREALAIARRISSPSDPADTLLLAAAIYKRLGRAGHAKYAQALTDGLVVNAAPQRRRRRR